MNFLDLVPARLRQSTLAWNLRITEARFLRRLLYSRKYPERLLNFYFLSTGRVGTRFFATLLGTAANATVLHQPGPNLRRYQRDLVEKYTTDKKVFECARVADYPLLEEKILRQLTLPVQVYGDTLNHMFPFGLMLYKYLNPKQLRLVHLVRHPVPCCRSILKAERDDTGTGRFHELRPPPFVRGRDAAEKAANIYVGINGMIRYQFEQINDPAVCKVFRLEDVSLETLRELFDFLNLKGFDEEKVGRLMRDETPQVRHSHLKRNPQRKDATVEELNHIRLICRPIAEQFGYEM